MLTLVNGPIMPNEIFWQYEPGKYLAVGHIVSISENPNKTEATLLTTSDGSTYQVEANFKVVETIIGACGYSILDGFDIL